MRKSVLAVTTYLADAVKIRHRSWGAWTAAEQIPEILASAPKPLIHPICFGDFSPVVENSPSMTKIRAVLSAFYIGHAIA
jgi:hypothetical protein